tara:strand:+ start:2339 stop:3322 length:984 start_codon:yes stop_codon:yes gene_type:complete
MDKEPITIEKENNYVLFPIRDEYIDLWKQYKNHVASFWTVEEIKLTQDLVDWEKLNKDEQHFIKYILAFFAASDGIVNENLVTRFMNDIAISEAKCFYGFQVAMENIHSETYSLLIDTFIKDEKEKNHLFNAINTIPCVKKKADWAIKWMSIKDEEANFASRLVGFAAVEGIFFSGSFCAIFWLKKRGLMPGLTFSNELISRDEGLHTDFAVSLYHKLIYKLDENSIHNILKEAVEIENEFINDSLPCRLIGMNSERMNQYIKFVADRLASQLGYSKIYNVTNPFDFMETIGMQNKTNFFEKKVSEYSKAGVGVDTEDMEFSLDGEF